MIEGLKVTVNAQELKALCTARAAYHATRAKTYRGTLAQLQSLDNPNSSLQPGREAESKIEQHEAKAAELQFIADHLVEAELYMLDRNDLGTLGIAYRGF